MRQSPNNDCFDSINIFLQIFMSNEFKLDNVDSFREVFMHVVQSRQTDGARAAEPFVTKQELLPKVRLLTFFWYYSFQHAVK